MSRRDTHVIVLGSGAGGMAAGLAAAAAGAHVVVLERAPWLGGTTATSGGGIWIPANPWAAAAGVADSTDDALRYLDSLRLGDVDPVVGHTYVREGVHVARSIAEHTGVEWQHLVGMSDYHAELPGRIPRWSVAGDPAGRASARSHSVVSGRTRTELRRGPSTRRLAPLPGRTPTSWRVAIVRASPPAGGA